MCGWNAVVTARDPATVRDIVAIDPACGLPVRLDVTDRAQIADAMHQAGAQFGEIDVLVNNAGYGYRAAVRKRTQPTSTSCSKLTSSGLWR
jgi:NAD(P)-dependent dehydrogenase (short-subunit alcohol dehydrogenase family)